MAPPCQLFPAQKLPSLAQIGPDGKVRKTADGRRIDLARDCELFGLVQYECVVPAPELRDSPLLSNHRKRDVQKSASWTVLMR
ncbi:d7099064-8aa8-4b86-9aeb-8dd72887b2ee [Thermothielavioides terrestris]|uniref:D7099064-8aa8-4b86-9aeb-8dd72887b2ee n=1 Tax=Thermothielavioides terrestris TaxID=2587410 RepID=A0A446BVN3_9PEZI|nr:d7099064-8aa8-4b86-9aeb-8dd72887b2ee [Thermothielavioides terrestris]